MTITEEDMTEEISTEEDLLEVDLVLEEALEVDLEVDLIIETQLVGLHVLIQEDHEALSTEESNQSLPVNYQYYLLFQINNILFRKQNSTINIQIQPVKCIYSINAFHPIPFSCSKFKLSR